MPTTPNTTWNGHHLLPLRHPDKVTKRVVNLKASLTYSAGQVVGPITASLGTYGPYASGNSDGSQLPGGVLEYDCTTDANGNITLGWASVGEYGYSELGAPVYTSGIFETADLVGLDANAVTKLGRLLLGTVSAGEVVIYGP